VMLYYMVSKKSEDASKVAAKRIRRKFNSG